MQDHVGQPELPFGAEFRRRRGLFDVALQRALCRPVSNQGDFFIGQPAFFFKIAVAGLGQPRRHKVPLGNVGDLGGMTLSVFVAQQGKGSRLARPVARRTVFVNDRCDVARESDGSTRCRSRPNQKECRQTHASGRSEPHDGARFLYPSASPFPPEY